MPIALVERKHAKWTIERLQEFLHRNQDDAAMNEELSNIEEMGDEARGAFGTWTEHHEGSRWNSTKSKFLVEQLSSCFLF